jgi:hypothetical protein
LAASAVIIINASQVASTSPPIAPRHGEEDAAPPPCLFIADRGGVVPDVVFIDHEQPAQVALSGNVQTWSGND